MTIWVQKLKGRAGLHLQGKEFHTKPNYNVSLTDPRVSHKRRCLSRCKAGVTHCSAWVGKGAESTPRGLQLEGNAFHTKLNYNLYK